VIEPWIDEAEGRTWFLFENSRRGALADAWCKSGCEPPDDPLAEAGRLTVGLADFAKLRSSNEPGRDEYSLWRRPRQPGSDLDQVRSRGC